MAGLSDIWSTFQQAVIYLGNINQTLGAGLPQITLPVSTAKGGTGQINGVPSMVSFGPVSGGTVAAATTIFLGVNGANATENTVGVPVPFAGTIRNLMVVSSAAPGAGQSFVYTFRKTAVSQTLTVTLSGAAQTSGNDITHSVSCVVGDTIDVQLVTSAAAAVCAHVVAIEFDKTP